MKPSTEKPWFRSVRDSPARPRCECTRAAATRSGSPVGEVVDGARLFVDPEVVHLGPAERADRVVAGVPVVERLSR